MAVMVKVAFWNLSLTSFIAFIVRTQVAVKPTTVAVIESGSILQVGRNFTRKKQKKFEIKFDLNDQRLWAYWNEVILGLNC